VVLWSLIRPPADLISSFCFELPFSTNLPDRFGFISTLCRSGWCRFDLAMVDSFSESVITRRSGFGKTASRL
jgi:hypothetical protein